MEDMSKREELAKNETRGVELGDARLERRFGQLMNMMARAPNLSFPHAPAVTAMRLSKRRIGF